MKQDIDQGMARRIAILLPSLAGGGAERSMLNLAGEFLAQGREVDLLLFRREGPYLADVPARCRVIELPAGAGLSGRLLAAKADPSGIVSLLRPVLFAAKTDGDLRHVAALRDYLRESPPDVLLSAMTYTNLVALWARNLAGTSVPVVVSERISLSHHLASKNVKPAWRWRHLLPAVRHAYSRADGILTVSESVTNDLVASTGLSRDLVQTVYNPVVSAELEAMAAEPLDHPWFAPGERPVVLGVGRLIDQKDFSTLLRAFAILAGQRAARLVILGDGRLRPQLEALARELEIEAYVDLPGFAENPYRYMARAGVFALSSIYEGLPGVLIQALACGCPVVSTDCPGGSAEILQGGQVGRLVPMSDPDALADALKATLAEPPAPEDLRASAAEFSVQRAGQRYLACLDGVVASRAGRK